MNEKILPLDVRLANAAKEIASCEEKLSIIRRQLSIAHSDECTARNALNKAQKEFDALVEEVKKAASKDSDWHDQRTHGFPCE